MPYVSEQAGHIFTKIAAPIPRLNLVECWFGFANTNQNFD